MDILDSILRGTRKGTILDECSFLLSRIFVEEAIRQKLPVRGEIEPATVWGTVHVEWNSAEPPSLA